MPRIRSVKPEFFLDDEITSLPYQIRLAFIGLWCHADRDGRLEDKPRHLKAVIFPYDEVDMESTLERLENHPKTEGQPFITRYEAKGHRYIQINNFNKHQRPHHTEQKSIIPPNTPLDNRVLPVQQRSVLKEAVLKEEGKEEGKEKEEEEPLTEYEQKIETYFDNKIKPLMMKKWKEAHPSIDVQAEILKAKAWLYSNQDRKRYSRFGRFLGNWMGIAANPPPWMKKEESTLDIMRRQEKEEAHGDTRA